MKLSKADLKRRFPKYADQIATYKNPDTEFTVNEDEDLDPITISIPYIIKKTAEHWSPKNPPKDISNPDWSKVDGFGLYAKDQYFRRPEKPENLIYLEETYSANQEEFWEALEEGREKYKDVIEFIKRQIYHFYYGYWFFCNGKPTYITGWQYRQLTTYKGKFEDVRDPETGKKGISDHPEYRDRARRKFLFYQWCYVDTTDHNGKEYGQRTCLGYIYPKGRRDGASTDAVTVMMGVTHSTKKTYSSIIANNATTSKSLFQKQFVGFWREQPVWCRAVHDGTDRPKSNIRFNPKANSSKRKGVTVWNTKASLDNYIDYADKVGGDYYDHNKVNGVILADEGGKTTEKDVQDRHYVITPAMRPSGNILKYCLAMYPSTVEEMESGGGENFKALVDDSIYQESSDLNGQTTSGLRLLYIPTWDGMSGYIGKYGESLIEDLTPEQKKFSGLDHGAKEYIFNEIKRLENRKGIKSRENLNNFKRRYPTCFADCFRTKGSDNGFNREKLEDRIAKLNVRKYTDFMRVGNLYWRIDGADYSAAEFLSIFGNRPHFGINPVVIFKEDPDGRFHISQLPNNKTRNKIIKTLSDHPDFDYTYIPEHPDIFTVGADPMGYLTESKFKQANKDSRVSDGACAVLLNRDPSIDHDSRPTEEWQTYKFVCDYLERTNESDEYDEEMLMVTVFYGGMMYAERNKEHVNSHFVRRGFSGLLKHRYNIATAQFDKDPGVHTTDGAKQRFFTGVRNYIEYHVHKEQHLRILKEWAKIKGMDQMTKYDLFAASAIAIDGSQAEHAEFVKTQGDTIDLSNVFQEY